MIESGSYKLSEIKIVKSKAGSKCPKCLGNHIFKSKLIRESRGAKNLKWMLL